MNIDCEETSSFFEVFYKIYSEEMFAGQSGYNVLLFPMYALQRTMTIGTLF